MKKLIILLLLLICCGCTQHLIDDKGIITKIELSDKEGIFNVYLEGIDKYPFCYGWFDFPKDFYFETSTLYHIGDTINFTKL